MQTVSMVTMVSKNSENTALRHIKLILAMAVMLAAGTVGAQTSESIEDNIRPVSQVCLAGQACAGRATATSTPTPVAAPAVVAPEPVVAEVVEPAAVAAAAQSDFDAAGSYQQFCFACHGTGAAGAPEPGDAEGWDLRMEKGMDAVMANVINGLNAMPARVICMTCRDSDLNQIVDFMLSQ